MKTNRSTHEVIVHPCCMGGFDAKQANLQRVCPCDKVQPCSCSVALAATRLLQAVHCSSALCRWASGRHKHGNLPGAWQ